MKKIAVLIVTYNPDLNVLARLIKRLSSSSLELGIFIVDNASTNSSRFDKYNNVNLILLDDNIGLAGAQNVALKEIIAADYDFVLFFDQDSEPTQVFVSHLIQAATDLEGQGYKVGGVGPVFFDPRTNTDYPHEMISGLRIKKIYPTSDQPLIASFLINSGMLVSTNALMQIGMMRSEFFIDYIDIEWCLRAADKGYYFFAIPKAKMSHTIGDERKEVMGREVSIHSPIRRYYFARNSILMLRLSYVPFGYKLRELVFSFLRTILFVSCVENKKNYLRYIFKGWKDGVLGKSGKYVE